MTLEKASKWQLITVLIAIVFIVWDLFAPGYNPILDMFGWVFLVGTFYFMGRVHGGDFENRKRRARQDNLNNNPSWRNDV